MREPTPASTASLSMEILISMSPKKGAVRDGMAVLLNGDARFTASDMRSDSVILSARQSAVCEPADYRKLKQRGSFDRCTD